MPEEHLKCPKCGHEFDYYYSVSYSLTSLKISQFFRAKCPNCGRVSLYQTHIDIKRPRLYRAGMIASLFLVMAGIAYAIFSLIMLSTYDAVYGILAVIAGLVISFALDLANRRYHGGSGR
ncbi:MAG: hypothetical protein QXN26_07185 [Thermoplasmataceae archaeon]